MISQHFASLMGGTITVESQSGRGSRFIVRIPFRLSKQVFAPRHGGNVIHNFDLKNLSVPLSILAVDDNDDSRSLIGLFLRKLGHETVVANSGRDAIEKIKGGNFDIVLMDVQMPEMSGYEATAAIRDLADGKNLTPIVALTANAMTGDSDRAFKAGMDDYLSKPVDITALRDLLNRWAARIVSARNFDAGS